jgi:quinoprotein relay system zinc metallohydrolase 1
MKPVWRWLAAALACPALAGAAADPATLDYRLSARALAPGVYVVEGANEDFSVANGCNIINTGFVVTDAGVVVIDTGPSRRYGEQLRALIARTTSQPVAQVWQLNLHPDYFLGNQAFADVPRYATEATRAGVAREAASYETNLYRLCGDWMRGTETVPPDRSADAWVAAGGFELGGRRFDLRLLRGHTGSDLVLRDRASGVAFVGGLVFRQRIPTTPHADLPAWLDSLQQLQAMNLETVVPSHGPVHQGDAGIVATRGYLQWLDRSLRRWAAEGWTMNEVLRAPVPPEYRAWAAFDTEWLRNVAHLYPRYEREARAAAGRGAR